ncbi:Cof-type HAD-IIB family hydrolase [Cohnella sp. CFH 77786]|uniref:Cof-type HAD-IIB family hydrolase n=1 Tax=Cohnella sp. CFH 77786 TaxID=2662265 RepID=UPI001C61039A|nr:Cof-type HAD-IIB family hydrolase [Cohnella sp. CFH 77786]MBW5447026.1 Cof-type HAD-IIB family hydrolase [Cohnella sp. CFH 77786]
MSYRLMAMDLDDTLLTDDLTVTESTKEAMKKAIAQGVRLTIATGRMFDSAQRIARQIGLNVPIITYQGSLIKNLLDEQVLYERSVPAEAAFKLYEYCRERGLHLQTYIDDKLYAPEENDKLLGYANLSKIPYTIEPDFGKLMSHPKQTKLLIIDEPVRLDAMIPELRELLGHEVHVTKSKPHFLEFMHHEGTKGHALRFLAAHFGIPIEETIAIGDAMNDREMIEAAGLGVAMSNSVPALKEIADYVTLSNNDDGVRHVLEKFVLNA